MVVPEDKAILVFQGFYLSAEDELMVRRGGDRFKTIISTLEKAQDSGEPVTSKLISNLITGAQKRSEGVNSEIRKKRSTI